MGPFGMGIANPIMWTGIYALTIPALIHLMTRRTPVRILFPTLQFLKNAKANQSRLFRIRHILLLLLRTLLLALILGAFLRPTYRAGALSDDAEGKGRNATIIVLDTSASMGYAGAGVTPFARGQVAVGRIIDDLANQDVANLILAGAAPRASFEGSLAEQTVGRCRFQLKRDLQEARAGLARADVDAAIAMAVRQFNEMAFRGKGVQKEIHFVSDFQRTNWGAVNYAAIPEEVKVVFISVSHEAPANSAVTEVQVKPPYPAVGEAVDVTCKVANYAGERRDIPVTLTVDEESISSRTLTVEPGMTASATFRLKPNRSGIFEGRFSVPDDAMHFDNARFFALSVSERLPVTILTDEAETARAASHRFLTTAINPFDDQSGVFVPTVMAPDQLDVFAARRSHVILVSGVEPFSVSTAKTLVDYLRNGGGVIYFLADVADGANLQLLVATAEGDLQLPYTVGALVDTADGEDDEPASLYEANYDHPMLKVFRETGALASLQFYRIFSTKREETQGQVLLRYGNGHIALASKSVGLGALLLANFSVDLEGSDVARHTVFVPLVHKMLGAMRPESGGAQSFEVGVPCSTTVTLPSTDAPLRFTTPAGEEISAGIDIRQNEGAIVFGATEEVGFYRAYSGSEKVGAVAVNVDDRESNLEALSLEQLEELSNIARERFYTSEGNNMDELRRLRHGAPIWHHLALAAMALLAIEQLAALAWRR